MLERKFGCMQTDARERRAAVKRIAENRKAVLRRVNANLMRAARERLGITSYAADGGLHGGLEH